MSSRRLWKPAASFLSTSSFAKSLLLVSRAADRRSRRSQPCRASACRHHIGERRLTQVSKHSCNICRCHNGRFALLQATVFDPNGPALLQHIAPSGCKVEVPWKADHCQSLRFIASLLSDYVHFYFESVQAVALAHFRRAASWTNIVGSLHERKHRPSYLSPGGLFVHAAYELASDIHLLLRCVSPALHVRHAHAIAK